MATHSNIFLPGESVDREAWQATVHGVAKSQTRLSYYTTTINKAFHVYIIKACEGVMFQ